MECEQRGSRSGSQNTSGRSGSGAVGDRLRLRRLRRGRLVVVVGRRRRRRRRRRVERVGRDGELRLRGGGRRGRGAGGAGAGGGGIGGAAAAGGGAADDGPADRPAASPPAPRSCASAAAIAAAARALDTVRAARRGAGAQRPTLPFNGCGFGTRQSGGSTNRHIASSIAHE